MSKISKKGFSILAALSFSFITTQVYADIVVQAPFAGKNDVCEQIAGKWTGEHGKAVVWGIISCDYNGAVQIESKEAGKINLNNLTLTLNKDLSSFLCPSSEVLSLSGECHNGKIIIHSDSAKLDGSLSEDGQKANVTGTVTFSVPVLGKLSPNVDVALDKAKS